MERELSYLTVHSVLHLLGYDHMDEGPMKRQMRVHEEFYSGQTGHYPGNGGGNAMSTPPYLRLVPLEEEEEPVEVELEISPRDLAVMAASVCAALAAFWWLWKRLVK